MPSTSTYEVSFEPLASRLTDEQLKDLTMASSPSRGRRPNFDYAEYRAQRELRKKISEFLEMKELP